MNLAMPLPTTNYDTPTVDTSSRRGQRQKNDSASQDSKDFGGALADVADTGASNRDGSQKTKNASATDSNPASATDAPDDAQGAAQTPSFVDALTDLLSQALQSKSGTKTSTADDGKNSTAASKGDAAAQEADNTATPAPSPGADLMAMMMAAGLAARPASPPASQQSAAGTTKSPTLPATAATATDETPEVILSKPVLETHLAPVTPTGAGAAQPGPASTTPATFADALVAKANAAKANAQPTTPAANLNAPPPPSTSNGAPQSDAQSGGNSAGQELSSSAAAALQQTAAHNLTPAQSAIRSIAAAVGELANQPASSVQVPDPNAQQPAVAPARTMTLQMSPPDLGTVDIRLHVTGDSLDVQLKLSNSETLGMVHRDREALSAALQDQNYKLNSLVIQDGGASASSGGQNAAAQGGGSASYSRQDPDSGRASQNNGQAGGQRSQQDDSGSGRQRSGPERRPTSGGDLRSGGLFI